MISCGEPFLALPSLKLHAVNFIEDLAFQNLL